MARMVTVMVLPAGGAPIRTVRIDGDDSHELVKLVQGNLGTCSLPVAWRARGYYAFCDDDAMIRPDLPAVNAWAEHLGHYKLRGPIVIIRARDDGETGSLSRADVADLEMLLLQPPSKEALRAAANEQQFWLDHPSGMAILNPETGRWE